MFAKRFFYVSVGLLCLAIAYHLGAENAAGQSNASIEGVNIGPAGISAVVNGVLEEFDPNTGQPYAQHPIPVAAPVAETGGSVVIYQNGDVYAFGVTSWIYEGNLAGEIPTPVHKISLGALKVKYR